MTTLLLILALNYLIPMALCGLYVCWLWALSGDVKFLQWEFAGGWLPIMRFELISTKSWYAKLWKGWYGVALVFAIITRPGIDRKGISHEMHHCLQQLSGAIFWVAMFVHMLYISLLQKQKHPYWDNWAERGARKAAGQLL